jgi:LysM repeat protein
VSNDTNSLAEASNNVPTPISNNIPPVAIPAPISVPPPVVTPSPVVEVPSAGAEYVVVHGDTLAKIAKKNGVSVKALENANPSVQPTKLKVGQKLTLPAGGKPVSDTSAASPGFSSGMPDISSEVYVVKTGDTLTKIAKSHGTTVKALEAANNLSTTRITVGKKLKIPVKGEAAAPAAPAEAVSAPVAPGTTPASVPNFTPVTTPTAAPTH